MILYRPCYQNNPMPWGFKTSTPNPNHPHVVSFCHSKLTLKHAKRLGIKLCKGIRYIKYCGVEMFDLRGTRTTAIVFIPNKNFRR